MARGINHNWGIVIGALQFLWIISVCGIQLSIEPNTVEAIRPRDIDISCQPFGLLKTALQILAIRIGRPDQSLLAAVHDDVNIAKTNEIHVIGHVDGEVNGSFLNVTMHQQTSTAAGDYDCEIVYLDDEGQIQREKGFAALKEEKTDINKLGSIVRSLIGKVDNLEGEKDLLRNDVKTLQDKLKNATKESHKRVVAMKTVIENQRQQIKVDEDNLKKLKGEVHDRDVKIAAQENKLQESLNVHEKLINDILKKDKSMDGRVTRLETKDKGQADKILRLENADLNFGKELNAAKDKFNSEKSKFASKQSVNIWKTDVKKQINGINSDIRIMKTTQANDKNTIVQSMKNLASKADLKILSDKEIKDFKGIRLSVDKEVLQAKNERSKMSSKITNLERKASNNGKAIEEAKKRMTKDEQSARNNIYSLKKSDESLSKYIKSISDGANSRESRVSQLSASLNKQSVDLKKYVNSAISAKHPTSTSHKISLHGIFGRKMG